MYHSRTLHSAASGLWAHLVITRNNAGTESLIWSEIPCPGNKELRSGIKMGKMRFEMVCFQQVCAAMPSCWAMEEWNKGSRKNTLLQINSHKNSTVILMQIMGSYY